MKRSKMTPRSSKKLFTKTASFVNKKNGLNSATPLRGGIRL